METNSNLSHEATFNLGVNTVYRMNNLLLDINDHARQGIFLAWMFDLDQLYKELIPFISKDKRDLDSTRKLRNKVKDHYNVIALEMINLKIKPERDDDVIIFFQRTLYFNFPGIIENLSELEVRIDEFEIKLRMMMGKYKLLMPDKADPRFAFGKT